MKMNNKNKAEVKQTALAGSSLVHLFFRQQEGMSPSFGRSILCPLARKDRGCDEAIS